MKKFATMIVFIIMLFLMGTISANAKESYEIDENIKISKSMQSSAPDTFYMNPSDVLNGTMRSKTVPTKYWNLTNNPYTGNLIEVRVNWLYTNYYFAPNSNGIMYLDYNIKPYNTEGTRMNIGVYNISTGKFVKYYETGGVPTAACIQIKELKTNQHYALAFTAIRDPLAYNAIQGTIKIFH